MFDARAAARLSNSDFRPQKKSFIL